jgi:hypothetical protein
MSGGKYSISVLVTSLMYMVIISLHVYVIDAAMWLLTEFEKCHANNARHSQRKVYVTQIDIIESLKLSFTYSHHMSGLEQESWARGPEYAVIDS